MSEEPERPASPMQEPRHSAYQDLRGLIGQWMADAGKDQMYTILYLRRIVADLEIGLHCDYAWRLARLEQRVELPGESGLDVP